MSVRNNLLAEIVIRVGIGKRSGKKRAQQNLQKTPILENHSCYKKGKSKIQIIDGSELITLVCMPQ